jgi:hypothetical protein
LAAHIEERHGFGLDIALARFIAGVDQAGEADRAVQLTAALLTPRDRLRALLRAAEEQQIPALWEALRTEAAAQDPDAGTAGMSREELAGLCEGLLAGVVAPE